MLVCIVDGNEVKNRETLHDVLARSLRFPEWYGRNLDALYDCLTDAGEELEIRFLHGQMLREHLGEYTDVLVEVVGMAAGDNPRIHFIMEES